MLALGCMALVLWVMYGWFPYGFGYGSTAEPVWKNLLWMWDGKHLPEWEHCPFVPLICLGLVYWKRRELMEIPVQGTNAGIWLMVLAGFVYWLGYMIDIVPFSFVSIQITLGALMVWLLGWPFFRALLFPYLFLVFAWPMPFLDNLMAFQLKVVMTEISYGFLNLIGIACIRSGTAILSAADYRFGIPIGSKFSLEVADPCSGIRSLYALMMLSALAGYLFLPKVWQRWVLFGLSLPLAVAGNFGRILMLTFGTLLMGQEVALGKPMEPSFYHMLSGYIVFAVALTGMLLTGWLMDGGWKMIFWLAAGRRKT